MKYSLACSILLLSLSVIGQSLPVLVKDFAPGTTGANPQSLTVFGTDLLMTAGNPAATQLWKYNSTGAAVQFPASVEVAAITGPFAVARGKLFFAARKPPATSLSIWAISVGGSPTPVKYTDTMPAPSPDSKEMAVRGNELYFCGRNAGEEGIYVLDAANHRHCVVAAKNLNSSGTVSDIDEITVAGDRLFFTGSDANSITGLFAYRFATKDVITVPLPGINQKENIRPQNLSNFGDGKLYFTATTPAGGRELYVIAAGTANATSLTTLNGQGDGISSNDGARVYHNIAKYGNDIYFAGYDQAQGDALMKCNITSGAVALVKTINPSGKSGISNFIVYHDNLYFSASDDINGDELWVTNYHDSTTKIVADIMPGPKGAHPRNFCIYRDKLYFSAENGTSGNELFSLQTPAVALDYGENQLSAEILPNPATDLVKLKLHLEKSIVFSIVIYNSHGKQVYNVAPRSYASGNIALSFSIRELPADTYRLTVVGPSRKVIYEDKLIKE